MEHPGHFFRHPAHASQRHEVETRTDIGRIADQLLKIGLGHPLHDGLPKTAGNVKGGSVLLVVQSIVQRDGLGVQFIGQFVIQQRLHDFLFLSCRLELQQVQSFFSACRAQVSQVSGLAGIQSRFPKKHIVDVAAAILG